jgi:hypothetical protein
MKNLSLLALASLLMVSGVSFASTEAPVATPATTPAPAAAPVAAPVVTPAATPEKPGFFAEKWATIKTKTVAAKESTVKYAKANPTTFWGSVVAAVVGAGLLGKLAYDKWFAKEEKTDDQAIAEELASQEKASQEAIFKQVPSKK